jgi:hypothetical protein
VHAEPHAIVTPSLVLSFGDLVGRFDMRPLPPASADQFLSQLCSRYAPFLLPADAPASTLVAATLDFVPTPAAASRERQMEEHPLVVSTTTDAAGLTGLTIERWDFAASLALRTEGVFRGHARCEMNPHSFDSLLRVIWSVLLPHNGGAILHACGIHNGGQGFVFPGVSERGKTTLARKVPNPDDVLSDELVIVRAQRSGAWLAYGTPFWGDFQRGGISRHGLPLAAIGFLEQAAALGLAPLSPAAAALRLLECWLAFETDPGAARRNLALAVSLCRESRVLAVHTRRETPVAAILDQLAAPSLPVPAHSFATEAALP